MSLKFRRQLIADMRYESAGAFDVTGNGVPDIVSGEWWYEGPEFRLSHRIGEIMVVGEYFDDFSTIPMDINGNGEAELITGERYRAHNGRDPGSSDDVGIYCFKWTGEQFAKRVIDYGPRP